MTSSLRLAEIFMIIEEFPCRRPLVGFTEKTLGEDVWTLKAMIDEDLFWSVRRPSLVCRFIEIASDGVSWMRLIKNYSAIYF